MITNKELAKVICIACNDTFGSHSKREIIKCAFRMQGTLVHDAIENKEVENDSRV